MTRKSTASRLIQQAAEFAQERNSIDGRACAFAAYLSGALKMHDPVLADMVEALTEPQPGDRNVYLSEG
ncbi:hypothetical protein [Massilia sp.]|uniref:hypothetical protein n=1 Tax=Massilia sp. TaxID=1882437 RepID=UPI00289AE98D|nr:hypothetical protein [Massilia sp.]